MSATDDMAAQLLAMEAGRAAAAVPAGSVELGDLPSATLTGIATSSEVAAVLVKRANNLTDVTAATARTNLGLGSAATMTPTQLAADAALTGTYVPRSAATQTITYNGDGTVATVTENDSGAVITYTYNADGTVATEARVLGGVTTTRTFTYSAGNLVGIA